MNLDLLKLDPAKQMLVRQYTNDAAPNLFVVYLLLILGGIIGAHIWYLCMKAPQNLRIVFFVAGVIYLCTFAFGGLALFLDLFMVVVYTKLIKDEHEKLLIQQFMVDSDKVMV